MRPKIIHTIKILDHTKEHTTAMMLLLSNLTGSSVIIRKIYNRNF